MILVSSCSCLCPIYWSQVLSWEWRCSWSSADRRCSNYIRVIINLIAQKGASYIRDLTVGAIIRNPGSHFNIKMQSYQYRCLTNIGIPIIKIRRSHDRLIFIMGIPTWRDSPYFETGPRNISDVPMKTVLKLSSKCQGVWLFLARTLPSKANGLDRSQGQNGSDTVSHFKVILLEIS